MLSMECSWKLSGNELEEHDARLLLNAATGQCSLLANSTVQRKNESLQKTQSSLARKVHAIAVHLFDKLLR